MKKQRLSLKICAIFLVFLLTIPALISCGAASEGKADAGNYSGGIAGSGGSYGGETSDTASPEGGFSDTGVGTLPSGGVENPTAKVIKTANARMKTDKYDEFISNLYAKITEFGAYTDGETFSGGAPHRYASITIRIPAERLDDFKTALSSIGAIEHYSATKRDVSLTYATLQAEVDTLTKEITVIEELFEVAKTKGTLQDISNLEARLTELHLRIARARAQLSVYDNSIVYSTLYLSVDEYVPSVEPEEEEKGVFSRIGDNLIFAFKGIGNFFTELFVFLVSALPYIAVVAAFAAIPLSVIIIRKRKKHKDSKEADENGKESE